MGCLLRRKIRNESVEQTESAVADQSAESTRRHSDNDDDNGDDVTTEKKLVLSGVL